MVFCVAELWSDAGSVPTALQEFVIIYTNNNGHVEPRSHLLQFFKVLDHSWISQRNGFLISDSSPLVISPIKTK